MIRDVILDLERRSRERIRERSGDVTPRPILAILYAGSAPFSAVGSLLAVASSRQPVAGTAWLPSLLDWPYWAVMTLVVAAWLGSMATGAAVGWFLGSAITDHAVAHRASAYPVLFTAILLPVLIVSATLCFLPNERHIHLAVVCVIAGLLLAAFFCYFFHCSGWPENVSRGGFKTLESMSWEGDAPAEPQTIEDFPDAPARREPRPPGSETSSRN